MRRSDPHVGANRPGATRVHFLGSSSPEYRSVLQFCFLTPVPPQVNFSVSSLSASNLTVDNLSVKNVEYSKVDRCISAGVSFGAKLVQLRWPAAVGFSLRSCRGVRNSVRAGVFEVRV